MDNRRHPKGKPMTLHIAATIRRHHFSLSVTLSAQNSETIAIRGKNGSGKSTLFAAIAGLIPITDGAIEIDNRMVDSTTPPCFSIPPEHRNIGFLPQGGALFPHLTAVENVAFGLRARGTNRRESIASAHDMLTQFGIEELVQRFPHQLSGGQRQRVALARTLILRPNILLLDEPTVALDADGRDDVISVLTDVRKRFDGPILFTSHDDRDVASLATRVIDVHTSVRDGDTTSSIDDSL